MITLFINTIFNVEGFYKRFSLLYKNFCKELLKSIIKVFIF